MTHKLSITERSELVPYSDQLLPHGRKVFTKESIGTTQLHTFDTVPILQIKRDNIVDIQGNLDGASLILLVDESLDDTFAALHREGREL
jgi:hypothetical protein